MTAFTSQTKNLTYQDEISKVYIVIKDYPLLFRMELMVMAKAHVHRANLTPSVNAFLQIAFLANILPVQRRAKFFHIM